MTTFGSARISENGTIDGNAGDQTGREVATEPFYISTQGWYIIRAKDPQHAKWLASGMGTACANPCIGYSQYDRYGIIKYGIKTTTKTNADCSSLVRAVIKWATGIDVGDFTTANERAVLLDSGLFTDVGRYSSGMTLYEGDILVTCTKGHTGIITEGAERVVPPKKRDQCLQVEPNLTAAQRWELVKDGEYYKIVNKNNGECLDLQGGKSEKMENGRVIHTYKDNGADAQRWKLEPYKQGSNIYFICSKIDPSFVVEVAGGAVAKRAYIQLHKKQKTTANQSAQLWHLVNNFNGGKSFINNKSMYCLDSNPKDILL